LLSSRLYIISISISRARNKSGHYVDIAPSGILPGSICSTIHENDLKNGEKELDEKAKNKDQTYLDIVSYLTLLMWPFHIHVQQHFKEVAAATFFLQ